MKYQTTLWSVVNELGKIVRVFETVHEAAKYCECADDLKVAEITIRSV